MAAPLNFSLESYSIELGLRCSHTFAYIVGLLRNQTLYSYMAVNGRTVKHIFIVAVVLVILVGGGSYIADKMKERTLTLESTGGGTVSGAGIYDVGTEVTVSAIPDDTHRFVSWCDRNGKTVSEDPEYTFIISYNTILKAVFGTAEYKVEVHSNYPGQVITGLGTALHGYEVILGAYATWGYVFVGWYENGALISTDSQYRYIATCDRSFEVRFSIVHNAHFQLDVYKSNYNTYSFVVEPTYQVQCKRWTVQIYDADTHELLLSKDGRDLSSKLWCGNLNEPGRFVLRFNVTYTDNYNSTYYAKYVVRETGSISKLDGSYKEDNIWDNS